MLERERAVPGRQRLRHHVAAGEFAATAPPTRFYPYIAGSVQAAVFEGAEKHPDARFQTVEEFGFALERPIDVAFAAPSQKSYPSHSAPPPKPPAGVVSARRESSDFRSYSRI